ncbi:MAG: chemotaxis protein CheB [Desulfobacterales bacterium]|nr:chemotaxis protein CheB [Desulfobacterales bacterium]
MFPDKDAGRENRFEAVVVGVSAGGLKALQVILSELDKKFHPSVIIVQHISPAADNFLPRFLNKKSALPVKQADEKEVIKSGYVYIAPPDYHLLVEEDKTFSLSVDGKINYARPCIDVLFETAAYAYGAALVGLLLTGANRDGSQGLKKIKEAGGLTIVEDPKTAEVPIMPQGAIKTLDVDHILSLRTIAPFLNIQVA